MSDRISQLSDWMKENNVDVCFITSKENVFYLSGFYSEAHERLLGMAVFQDIEPFLICPGMDAGNARKSGWSHEVVSHSDTDNPWELTKQAIGKRVSNVRTISIEKEHMNVERFEAFTHLFPKAVFLSAEEKLHQLRMVKDVKELATLREACQLADYAIEVGAAELSEGKTEMDILAAVEYELKRKGISEMSFSTMVLTGKNAAAPHGTPGLTKISRGDLVLFDLGVVLDGYCSDITRTLAFGEINQQQQEIYDAVLRAQLKSLSIVRPGVTCMELDQTARKEIAAAGYGDHFPHRLGHGLGISVHEYPSITETNPLELKEGMVFTIEPGIYVPDVAGVRIEDDVLVTANGFETLTKYPKELKII
ncbi:M24 family metallopeptidase [Mesobacillus harenae]|uniref:M24 family metallopeptidase n=1 Tax=Mesobacillus harenae TaxID=2213203 RepID=UPI001580061F|nr:Xaa-Pro peptidase family protein [Mesobacillus harenae]